MWHRVRRIVLVVMTILLGLGLLLFLSGAVALRGSLPRLRGEMVLAGLAEPVTVARDALGVPNIVGHNRQDVARALGYLHGQERFFQMDLQRRRAAGELAALLGPVVLPVDRDTRRHRFRDRARQVVAATTGLDGEVLVAYSEGVNAGLDDLRVRPFEYILLRQRPVVWRPEDTVLTLYAMFLDLSLDTATTEQTWAAVRDHLPSAVAALVLPRGNRWEAPLETGLVSGVVVPDSTACIAPTGAAIRAVEPRSPRHDTAGSNNWAVAGRLTAHGGAILANDMHLGLGLPNIWYRAQMSWPEGGHTRTVVGVTLPGTPALVVGSNGQVAWGFTNSYGDWVDLVVLETEPGHPAHYRTPDGWRDMEYRTEVIKVAGAAPDTLVIEETIWGPVWDRDSHGRRRALRWTAHDVATVNIGLMHMESVPDVAEAMDLAGALGMPQQNLACVDAEGHIGWTIAGSIPRRVGWDGRLPVSWARGTCRWDGYLAPDQYPRVVDPDEGRIWTANNRVVSGHDLAVIGDGGYALGARARQIRDDLRALDHPGERDLMGVQLDDHAIFMAEWRTLALAALRQIPPVKGSPRASFLDVVGTQWSGRAEGPSVAYRLVREFSYACIDGVYSQLIGDKLSKEKGFRESWLPYRHAVAWEVIAQRTTYLLPPTCLNWDDFVLQAVDRVMARVDTDLSLYTWGAANAVHVGHPFTQLMPSLARWLAAPVEALPGDSFMPRVQHARSGASERLVVSPGREELGLFHMPGGQSGHPLSPFFLADHRAWADGKATPLQPGAAVYELKLRP